MWNDSDKMIQIYGALGKKGTKFPSVCPECGGLSAHVYMHRHGVEHCGIWIWCSTCGAYSHLSGIAPIGLENPDFIDPTQLCAEPEYLNRRKDRIDEWVNSHVVGVKIEIAKPFVTENRFDVILKENLQGIPAGTAGVIVITDDFKTAKIEFIGPDGKKNAINEPAENLPRLVDVIGTAKK